MTLPDPGRRGRRWRRGGAAAAVAGLACAPALPAPASALAVAFLGALWTGLLWPAAAPRRTRRVAALCLSATAVVLAVPWLAGLLARADGGGFPEAAVQSRYTALWEELDTAARAGAAALPGEPSPDEGFRRDAFRALGDLVTARGPVEEGTTLLLVDPDGEAVAWAGEGLLMEPGPGSIARSGRDFFPAFGSVTITSIEPLADDRRPWRLLAGRSLPTDRWPFDPPAALGLQADRRGIQWSLLRPGEEPAPGASVVRVPEAPAFVFLRPRLASGDAAPWRRAWPRTAWGLLGLLLLGIAAFRVVRAAFPGRGGEIAGGGAAEADRAVSGQAQVAAGLPATSGVVAGSGAAALALAVGSGPLAASVLGIGTVLAAGAASLRRRPRSARAAGALAAAGAFALSAGAWCLLEAVGGPEPETGSAPDLGSGLWPGAEALALRLGMAALALAILLAARPRRPRSGAESRSELWAGLGLAALLGAGMLHDFVFPAVALQAGGAAAWALWAGGRRLVHPMSVAALAVGAALLGAAAWETAFRLELERELGRAFLPRMAPPSEPDLATLESELREHFAGLDLAERVPRSPDGLGRDDLAFFLWRSSPLARPNSLSALAVEPRDGPTSSFSVGPPVESPEGPDLFAFSSADWALPVWEDTLTRGEAVLSYAGNPWGRIRFWVLPRPGFGLGLPPEGPVELELLRGRPAADRRVRGLPEPALYALYAPDGRALLSPWTETPPLPPALSGRSGEARGRVLVTTPAGPAWAWARGGRDGTEVLFLPVRRPVPALERVGTHALTSLLALAGAAGVLVLLALPRPAFRSFLGRTLRSYSKRLIVVFTLLLLIPLFLLNLVILSDAEERLSREQRAAGEAALASAQRMVGDLVASYDPGFAFTTLVDDGLLMWISHLVHHEVNLYWGSSIWASSKPELFAAGLLPERIPGEVFSRLTLGGYELASRTTMTRGTGYLELYAPLRIPGGPAEQERLFLSVPLSAQEEEVARELAALRRRVVLASAALFALLVAVGVALAQRFSQPLEELVEGTRRIAAGARSLDLAPSELELAALVRAVDEMAGRIAESRSRLVREKEVVDRMVDNITSGVVSLDRERRILMHNRVAAQLLGVRVGEGLDAALARSPRLEPVARELAGAGDRPVRTTVRLGADDGGEEREWTLVWVPVPGAGEPAALLVVEDATDVLRSQRLQAWAEMARIIAHEIKNPLTPLRLSTEHLREVYRDAAGEDRRELDEVFERCTTNILRQVEELRDIASEFSAFSSIPRIEPRPGDPVEPLRELVEAYEQASAGGVDVSLEADGEPMSARFDARLLGRAVRNLLENAVRASPPGGRVVLRVAREDGTLALCVQDSGPGVPAELLGRIFDPYFSTHDTGTGLGLPIARRIAEEHGGSITARNRTGGGLEVTIRIPL